MVEHDVKNKNDIELMNKKAEPILSIIIISHNQRELLRRCLDSILVMRMPFAYEIIVSDDRSQDGTIEMLHNDYKKLVRLTQCNSDECNPPMTSVRAGYNRINGLMKARGKYIIHVDGDDFYTSNDIFHVMVEALETHPQCNICVQNYRVLNDGTRIEDSSFGCNPNLFIGNPVISAEDFVQRFPYIHNSACCVRKAALQDVNVLTGYTYDDVDITYQYIGKGKVILLNRSNFIHVRYNYDTASHFGKIDQRIQWASSLYLVDIAPQLTGALLKSNLNQIYEVARLGIKNVKVSQNTINLLSHYDISILKGFDNKFGVLACARFYSIYLWIRLIKFFHLERAVAYRILYRLSIRWTIKEYVQFGE